MLPHIFASVETHRKAAAHIQGDRFIDHSKIFGEPVHHPTNGMGVKESHLSSHQTEEHGIVEVSAWKKSYSL